MKNRLQQQEGWALLTALVMVTLMVSIGLASFAYVGQQTSASRLEKTRDSSFNLDEGVLAQQAYKLISQFPQTAAYGVPDCTWSTGDGSATATGGGVNGSCLSSTSVNSAFTNSNPDYKTGVTWTTRVRDNQGSQACQVGGGTNCSYFYDDSSPTVQAASGCTAAVGCYSYDANGDNQVWVRASATVRGKVHTVVEMVRVDKQPVNMPNTVLTAGYVDFQNKHTFVFPGDSSVQMRCTQGTSCIDPSHVQPAGGIVYDYPVKSVLKAGDISALVARAQREGSYYTSCPSNPTGTLVVVLGTSGTQCGWDSLPATTPSSFATYIQLNGTLRLTGTNTFYGLIYLGNSTVPGFVNGTPLTDYVYYDNGNSDIIGSIIVDGPGGAHIGNGAKSGLGFDSRAFTALWSFGNQNIVKGTFRELGTR
jgi:Tfp pilus assembly protein PilX